MAEPAVVTGDVPTWMAKEYFEPAIEASLNLNGAENKFSIDEIHVKPATEAGDNFASKIYRVQVDVTLPDGTTKKTISLIVKALITTGLTEELLQLLNLFPKEVEMYTKFLPAFEEMYHSKGRNVSFGPKCLHHTSEPTVLVMEDLRDQDFRMANRKEGLDRNHAKVVLQRLAQLHAASAVYRETSGEPFPEIFNHGNYNENMKPMMEQQMKSVGPSFDKILRTWPNGDWYADMMEDTAAAMTDEIIAIIKARPDEFNVLTHGDAWCNNFLFRYDQNQDGKTSLAEIKLVRLFSGA
ncbi:uncharacterized protein LOC129753705 [Uranotaenia lowii]|uniref:uncharacterized protein LOC129753705 n=1 Tax=Uranotaenia lowii TaxID=190385 RepID=UPI002479D090|nr:uncharacterized protein LOC129753705 [Uranotaenia lowii]